ncbi:MAG: hypothetical protein CL677_10190 [Bdellovibrionaceae bacterium]|nr:hypothetical protein [Pseudobdellovibrionaceae bacterium]|tara:strand:- start:683 stop:1246 length:564 start_codon:yes stop_codon:yes gene_type:complete
MKHIVKGLVLVWILGALSFYGWLQISKPLNQGTEVPDSAKVLDRMEVDGAIDFEIETIDGKPFKLSDLKGKLILINFWASWCDPCVEEFPSMLKLLETMGDDLVLVTVSADYEMKELKKFLSIFDVKGDNFVAVWDKEKTISNQYHIVALPESFIIGKDFKLVRKVSGSEDWATPEAISFFKSFAAE